EWLKTLVHFFAQPGHQTTLGELRELLGYLQHLRDEEGPVSIKGWTLVSLRRRSAVWYEAVNQRYLAAMERRQQYDYPAFDDRLHWEGAPYRGFKEEMGDITYQIVQLRSAKALRAEGKEMCHCVASYAWRCLNHRTSIWSLQRIKYSFCQSLVTIEVNRKGQIVQAKGKFNAAPSDFQRKLIQTWAKRENIVL
ncbi:MAG: PcfJ domain-containing protein, partial [Bacteroidota bacterium]